MRMTRRVKPPTAAVTMTSTWPWSEAMSDAGGGGGMKDVVLRKRRCGKGGREEEGAGGCGKRENRREKV